MDGRNAVEAVNDLEPYDYQRPVPPGYSQGAALTTQQSHRTLFAGSRFIRTAQGDRRPSPYSAAWQVDTHRGHRRKASQ